MIDKNGKHVQKQPTQEQEQERSGAEIEHKNATRIVSVFSYESETIKGTDYVRQIQIYIELEASIGDHRDDEKGGMILWKTLMPIKFRKRKKLVFRYLLNPILRERVIHLCSALKPLLLS